MDWKKKWNNSVIRTKQDDRHGLEEKVEELGAKLKEENTIQDARRQRPTSRQHETNQITGIVNRM
jgi:hypothetical protein